VVVLFLPLFPTKMFFHISAATYAYTEFHKKMGLSRKDINEILKLALDSELTESISQSRSHLSFVDYLFKYESVGVLGIGLRPLGFDDICPECEITAWIGLSAGPFCLVEGGYFMSYRNKSWRVAAEEEHSFGWPDCAP
jgi:hypothetical protein